MSNKRSETSESGANVDHFKVWFSFAVIDEIVNYILAASITCGAGIQIDGATSDPSGVTLALSVAGTVGTLALIKVLRR